jgi:hypothetical protein
MSREKVRENKLRRMAGRQGLLLRKSRRRDERAIDYEGYMLLDAMGHAVFGESPFPFSASVDDVEHWLTTGRDERKG